MGRQSTLRRMSTAFSRRSAGPPSKIHAEPPPSPESNHNKDLLTSIEAWKSSHHNKLLPNDHEVEIKGVLLFDAGAEALAKELRTDNEVRRLFLVDNLIWPDGAAHLAKGVRARASALDPPRDPHPRRPMSYAYADPHAVRGHSQLLANETLQTLSLRKNPIGDNGLRAIAAVLQQSVTVLHLSIYTNSIGNQGAEYVAEMLEKNNTLQKLSLFSNSLGDHAANVLAKAVEGNRALRKLSVYSQNMSDDGASKLREAFNVQQR